MKLKDLNDKQVVQTTEENHKAFMKLLDKEGFTWHDGDSYLKDIYQNKFTENHAYKVKTGTWDEVGLYKYDGHEIIPASKFLKPTKKELLERIERIEKSVFPINQNSEPKQPTLEQEQEFREEFAKAIIRKYAKERPDLFEGLKLPTLEEPKPTEPKAGDLCAFADDESDFNSNDFVVDKLAEIKTNESYPYLPENYYKYKYARKIEIKFI